MPQVMPVRLGVVLAIVSAVSMLCVALVADDAKQLKNPGTGDVADYRKKLSTGFSMLSSFLPGCNNNDALGIFLCVLLAAVDGFVAGAVVGVLYNELPIKV